MSAAWAERERDRMAALVATGAGGRSLWSRSAGAHAVPVDAVSDCALAPALTERGDALTVAKQRVRALLAKLSAGGGDAEGGARSNKVANCERALSLFGEIEAATSAAVAGPERLVKSANEKGQALVKVLGELGLEDLREGGPVSLPSPQNFPELAIHYAQINWEANEGVGEDGPVSWTDDATLSWTCFGLLHGHATPGIMPAALCLLARVNRSPDAEFEGGKTSAEALAILKEAARCRLDGMASGAIDPETGDAANASVVWNAVCEAESMADMSAMFDLYRDPTDDPNDEDYSPEEEGPLLMEPYAACDACGTDLFLPDGQTCPGMGESCAGLQPFVVTAEQATEENSIACDMCCKICPEGERMRGCSECKFDLCSKCSGPWFHEMGGGRDFCGEHWAVAEDRELFKLVKKPEDLGDQMDDYFGDDWDGDGEGEEM